MHTLIVAVAQYGIVLVGLGAAVAWWRRAGQDRVTMVVAGAVTLVLLFLGIKLAAHLWVDPRPFVVDHTKPMFAHPADNGFPSDHTALGVAIAGVVAFWKRRVGVVLLAVAVLVGVARVAAHVHHVPDILGGAGIGAVASVLGVLVARRAVDAWTARASAGSDESRSSVPKG